MNSIIPVGIYILKLINSCFYALFLLKTSKSRHLNHKNSNKRGKFSNKWSPGEGAPPPPQPPIGFGSENKITERLKKGTTNLKKVSLMVKVSEVNMAVITRIGTNQTIESQGTRPII